MNQSYETEKNQRLNAPVISNFFDPHTFPLVDAKAIFIRCCQTEKILMQNGISDFLTFKDFQLNRENFEKLIHPDDLRKFQEYSSDKQWHQKFSGKGQLHIRFRIMTGEGVYIPIEQISGYFAIEISDVPSAEYFILRNNLFFEAPFEVSCKVMEKPIFPNNISPEIDELENFTQRQLQILEMMAKGYQNKNIAAKLFISAETVRSHKKQMLSRTGCDKLSDLLDYYHKRGFPDEAKL